MAISEILKEAVNAAEDKGWSVRAIALAAGVPQPSLSRWLRGERTLTLETAEGLCDFFECHLTKPKLPKLPK